MKKGKDLSYIISENILNYRLNLHLTQAEFAEKLNISDSHLANIERHASAPSLTLVQKILDTFQIQPEDILIEKKINFDNSQDNAEQDISALLTRHLEQFKLVFLNEFAQMQTSNEKKEYISQIKNREVRGFVADSKKD